METWSESKKQWSAGILMNAPLERNGLFYTRPELV